MNEESVHFEIRENDSFNQHGRIRSYDLKRNIYINGFDYINTNDDSSKFYLTNTNSVMLRFASTLMTVEQPMFESSGKLLHVNVKLEFQTTRPKKVKVLPWLCHLQPCTMNILEELLVPQTDAATVKEIIKTDNATVKERIDSNIWPKTDDATVKERIQTDDATVLERIKTDDATVLERINSHATVLEKIKTDNATVAERINSNATVAERINSNATVLERINPNSWRKCPIYIEKSIMTAMDLENFFTFGQTFQAERIGFLTLDQSSSKQDVQFNVTCLHKLHPDMTRNILNASTPFCMNK